MTNRSAPYPQGNDPLVTGTKNARDHLKYHLKSIRELVGDGTGQTDPGLCGRVSANVEAALAILAKEENQRP